MLLKSAFTDARVAALKPVDGHTHGQSAAMRGTASLLMDRLAAMAGLRAVFYQNSRADARNKRAGVRTYFWAKDFVTNSSNMLQEDGDLAAMVDVDYYVDMNKFLAEKFVPTVLYTFVPAEASATRDDYKYTFSNCGEVEYYVNGGGHYTHELWDWTGDSVAVEQWLFGLIPWRRAIYAIERRQLDLDHQLVLLAPLRRWKGPIMVLLSHWFAQCKRLQRVKPVVGDFIRLLINASGGMNVSTSTPGSFLAATVPAAVDDAVAYAAVTSPTKLTAYTVKSKMEKEAGTTRGYEVLHAFHLSKTIGYARVDTLEPYVRRFQWPSKGGYDQDAKPGMVAFMKPILDDCFVPDSCRGNDERAIKKRIEDLKKSPQLLDTFTSKVMDEYVELFWEKQKWQAHPMENSDVYERQSRPSQRRILDEAQHGMPTDLCRQFMKREAYSKVNDPRIISQINGVDKMDFSAYSYVVAEQQKKHRWYAFGKSPLEIAIRVADVCVEACVIAKTDCHRMDGHYDERANELHRRVFAYGFHRDHHVHLFETMRRMVNMRGITTHGVRCMTGQAEASGKASTAVDNSNLNAFMAFLGYRKTVNPRTAAYYTPGQAWDMLGIYAGDDGLSRDFVAAKMVEAADCMGQVLELEGVTRGEDGVTFLARRYGPDVWFGDPTSTCDLPRQLSKFHATTALPSSVTREVKLCEKAFAFALTDWNTPVIGEFVQRVAALFPTQFPDFQNRLNIWGVESDISQQYPNKFASWMDESAAVTLREFDRHAFSAWLSGTTPDTIFDIIQCAPRTEPVVKEDEVAVDGEIVQATTPPVKATTNDQLVPKAGYKSKAPRKQSRPRKPKSARLGPTRNR